MDKSKLSRAETDKAKLPMCLGETAYMGSAGISARNVTSRYYGLAAAALPKGKKSAVHIG
jgi:hypothetical protein